MSLFYFLHEFIPRPILVQIGAIAIRWYGFLIVLSFILGVFLLFYFSSRLHLRQDEKCAETLKSFFQKPDNVYDLIMALALGGIVGARLWVVFIVDWEYYREHLFDIFKLWQGGMAIHGALLGGAIALLIFARKKKAPVTALADLLVPALALGQAIGRWGNYFNQELFGWPTGAPWSIPIDPVNRPASFIGYGYFHPVFLYESALDFILFLVLFFIIRRGRYRAGRPIIFYLLGYAYIRFMVEFLRLDPTPELWGLRLPQWVSIIIFAIAIAALWRGEKAKKRENRSIA